jgi:hypothetical protein
VKAFELDAWLRLHSIKIERIGTELVFTHINGETSVLLPRDSWCDDLIPVEFEPLRTFYDEYFGASIGNSQLTFATNVRGGLDISHGFKLPDFNQMTTQARELGVNLGNNELAFLAEAGWMFIYSLAIERGEPVLRKYDRDFGNNRVIEKFEDVLTAWWCMVQS